MEEMLNNFKDKMRSEIIIQKIGENTYRFGTRKIQAKINQGILLVRVGGGYMDIDNFYKTYGEVELQKQQRLVDTFDSHNSGKDTGRKTITKKRNTVMGTEIF